MNKRFILLAVLLFAARIPAFAEKPAKPAGMAKFIVFLKHAPPVPPGQTPKKIVPPDVGKLGGVVLQVRDDYRVVYLPFAAAKQLRYDENVDYLQRVWMGETQEEWNATEAPAQQPASLMRLRANTLTETASWGPKKYSYDGSGNISQIAEFDANQIVKPIGTDTYRYDAVSRLTQAVVNGVTETYAYDAFGNLTEKQTGSKPPVSMPAEMSSNRLATLTYDIAGNVTSDPGKRFGYYVYDSMGMLVATSAIGGRKRMYYTADDERIGFSLDNSLSRWTIRDFEGRPLREFRAADPVSDLEDSDWIWTEDYVYAGGQLVAGETAGPFGVIGSAIQPDRRRRHFHLDHLGSVRLITADTDAAALGVHNYYPFGAEQTPLGQEALNFGGGGDIRPEPLRFTGHERDFNGSWNVDNDDYVDYMHARYYDPFASRFLAVDQGDATPSAPQSWNRYSYVTNAPINYHDPTGAYRTDFHHDLTQVLALVAGYSPAQAAAIAYYTQLVDEDDRAPLPLHNSAQRNHHFVSPQRMAELQQAAHKGGSYEVGTFLHALQDSFSHLGYEAGWGHFTHMRNGAIIGLYAGDLLGAVVGAKVGFDQGWAVDTTSARPGWALYAARTTYNALISLNVSPAKAALPFSQIEGLVQGYLEAEEHSAARSFYYNKLCQLANCTQLNQALTVP